MSQPKQLYVAMYHYIRDFSTARFPRIKGMPLDRFRQQVRSFSGDFEMATLESAMAYLNGEYQPRRNLCLMTFDDGLKEHYAEVTPLLAECGIQGLFFLITACLEDAVVAPVHMNHFLMAELGFERYRDLFNAAAEEIGETRHKNAPTGASVVPRTYPLDSQEVAEFKYMFNFVLSPGLRDSIVRTLFEKHIGSQKEFAGELYVSWDEARKMQRAGMVTGGHTHQHRPLATLTNPEMEQDLKQSRNLLTRNLQPQTLWPFSYPYGKADSFNSLTVDKLRELGFCCSLTTETGTNVPGIDAFAISRLDGQHHSIFNRHHASQRAESPLEARLPA